MQFSRLRGNIAVGSALFFLVVCDASVPASLPLSAPLDSPQPPHSEARSADGGLAPQNPHGLDALTLLGGSQESGFSSDEVEDPKPSPQPHYFWDEGGEINGTSLDPDITEGDSPAEPRGAAHGDLNSPGPSMAALGGALEPDLWESQGGASGVPDEPGYDPPTTDTAPLTPTTASATGVILRWDEGEDRGAVPRDEEAVLHGGEGGGVTQMTTEEDKGEYSPMEEMERMETVGSHGKTKGDESAVHHGKTEEDESAVHHGKTEGDESAEHHGEAEGDETTVYYGKTEDESAVHPGEAEGDETAVYYGKTEDESAVHHGKMEEGETVVHHGKTAEDESAVHHGKTEGDESTVHHGKTEGEELVVYYGKTKGDESAVHHGKTEGGGSTVHHGKMEGDESTVHHGNTERDEGTVHHGKTEGGKSAVDHGNTERDEGAVHHGKTEGDESTVHHGNTERAKGAVHHGKTEGEKSAVDHGKTDGEAGGWVHHTPLTTVPSSSSPSSSSLPRTTATDAPLHRPDPPFPPQPREPKLRRGGNEHSSDNDFPEKHPPHDSLQVICVDWSDLTGKGYVILNMSENFDCEEFRVESGDQLLEMLETAFSGKMSSPQGSWLISLSKPTRQDHQLLMTLTNDQGVIATKDVLSMLGEIKRGLHDIGIQNYSSVSSCQARPSQTRSDYGKLFVVLVIIGSVCVVIIASGLVYICWQRRLPKIKNTSRGEELHFVENGCHDNPTLDVASDSQSEMQEKKHSANGVAAGGGGGGGSRGSGWQVVVNEPGKEEAENMEEDTHL